MTDPTRQKFRQAANTFLHGFNKPLTFFVLLFSIATGYFAIVDSRVNSIVKNRDFIAEVARHVRPAMLFDSEGRVLADMGALALLDRPPEVKLAAASEKGIEAVITIYPHEFLRAEPIIEALDIGNSSITAKRTKGISWEITVASRAGLITDSYQPKELSLPRYRLELVP